MLADTSQSPQASRIGDQTHGERCALTLTPSRPHKSHLFALSRRLPSQPASQPLKLPGQTPMLSHLSSPGLVIPSPPPLPRRPVGTGAGLTPPPCPVRAAGAASWPRRRLCLPFALPAPASPSPFPRHDPLVPAAAACLPSLLPAQAACPPRTILWEIQLSFSRLVPVPPPLGCVRPMWGVGAAFFSADPASLFPAFTVASSLLSVGGQPQGSRDAGMSRKEPLASLPP